MLGPRHQAAPAVDGTADKRYRILIVEDNVDAARSLQVLLKLYGHEVAVEHSGLAGLASAQSWRPDIVLCDLGLPELDGFQVARALRQDPATTAIRLIAVSGYGQDDDRRRSAQAGFELHLTKPVDPDELRHVLTTGPGAFVGRASHFAGRDSHPAAFAGQDSHPEGK